MTDATVQPLPTATGLAAALAAGEISSEELTRRALAAIEKTQPTLNAFRLVRPEAAAADAADADRRLAAGERLPLLGVPVAIKDDMDIAGSPTAFGCAGEFPVKREDSEAVRRLRAAGAVIVGKTNTPELGQWPFTEGEAFGATRNPWHLDFSPGGSSGGSAAAVAAGVVPVALGSDGAGSVRIPASWTSLVGIKPQRGRISTWPDAEAFYGLTVNGPLARTVADAALLLEAATGPHPGDLHVPPAPECSFLVAASRDPGRLRIGLSLRPAFSGLFRGIDPQVRAGVERVAEVLAGLGHVVTSEEPAYRLIGANFMPRSHAGLHDWQSRVPDVALLDPRTQENCRNGRFLGGPSLALARRLEGRLRRRVGRVFARVDVLLAPTTAQPPLRVGQCDGLSNWQTDRTIVGACPYAWPWNVLGWPGISVPAGFTSEGLPFGVQLLGPANSETLLISLAAQLESVERWYERVPPHAVAAVSP